MTETPEPAKEPRRSPLTVSISPEGRHWLNSIANKHDVSLSVVVRAMMMVAQKRPQELQAVLDVMRYG